MPSDSTSRTLIALAALAAAAWCLWLVRDVLPPFVIALVLAMLLDPLRRRLQARGLPRGVAVALIFGVFLAVFVGVIALLVPRAVAQVGELLRHLDEYGRTLQSSIDRWAGSHAALLRALNLPPTLNEVWQRYQDDITRYLQAGLQRLFFAFEASAGLLGWLLIIPIVTLYLMFDLDRLRARLFYSVPDQHRGLALDLVHKVGGVFAAYFRGLTLICIAYGTTITLLLSLAFRLPYGLILGLLAVVLYAVPYLGQITLLLVSGIVAWATGHRGGYVAAMLAAMLVAGQLFDQLITPRVIGRQVGLHPVIGLFALMVGGQLFGLPGMVVAVPVAASVRVMLIELFPRLGEPLPEPGKAAAPDN